MKIAIIGFRSITDFDLSEHISNDTTEKGLKVTLKTCFKLITI